MTGRRPYAALVVALVGVSFASIFIRWSASPPVVIAVYRMGFATLLLLPFAVWDLRRGRWTLDRRDLAVLGAIGVVLAVHFVTWITSLRFTSVASSVILVNAHPLLVALLAHLLLRERVPRAAAGAILLGFAGVVLIAVNSAQEGRGLTGDLLALSGGGAAAVYLLAGRRVRQRVELLPYVFLVYGFTTLSLLAMTVGSGTSLVPPADAAREMALYLALALVSTILGHTLYNWALRYLPAPVVSTSLLGEPVGAALLALVLLAEVPTRLEVLGGLLALLGIYLTARGLGVADAMRPSG